ncbi:hypothetical protein QFC21_002177 [Naganishia friedmannii]|uniref:Uncharacterized protein n=1 Tax=Naganishia friedmannii TaxID=89922 RepID=A0ACC2VYW4_9TREE|nr:hypothetical protein QFC21_002177 [Naganishia friedmannii]
MALLFPPSPLATPNASFTDLPRAYSIGSLSHLNTQHSNNGNGNTASRRQSGLGAYDGSSSYDHTPENEKPELGAAGYPVIEGEDRGEGGAFGDPQGRGAQRLAARRDREKGTGTGYIPVSLVDAEPGTTGLSYNDADNANSNTLAGSNNAVAAAPYSSSRKIGNNPTRRRHRKWILLALLALFVLVGLGVGLGIGLTVGRKRNTGGASSNLASEGSGTDHSTTNSTAGAGVGAGAGNTTTASGVPDASVFTKDARLKDSFYGFAYTPQNVLLPSCGASLSNITRDIQLLSQLTNKIRLYGANCNQTSLVLQAIRDTKVQMGVYVAVYVDADTQAYKDQVQAIRGALEMFGTGDVLGITVGNEYILNQQLAGLSTATATSTILNHIKELNTTVKGWGLDKALPIGTSDAGSLMSATLARGIDYFHANGFAGTKAGKANHYSALDTGGSAPLGLTRLLSDSMTTADGNNGVVGAQGDASIANLQTFLDTFVCQANANKTDYFFCTSLSALLLTPPCESRTTVKKLTLCMILVEAFDEPWKAQYGGVEPYWGLFDSDRNLKSGLTIPDCSHT